MIFTTDKDMATAVIGLKQFTPRADSQPAWNVAMSAALLTMLPPVLVVVLLQRSFVKGWSAAANEIDMGDLQMIIVGHRGARSLWPENSLSGFRKLIAPGADAVEFDVHETRDGTPVVIHDPSLDRTTQGSGAISKRTAAEVLATPLQPGQGEDVELKTNAAGEPHDIAHWLAMPVRQITTDRPDLLLRARSTARRAEAVR